VLANAIREVWAPLFEHSHEPHKEDDSTLRNFFNIHSGGGEQTIGYQIQTFKAACDHADFVGESQTPASTATGTTGSKPPSGMLGATQPSGEAAIHIDLHIHLPENKTRRDYEYIFEDIAKYIFGRNLGGGSSD
jgi:hypothetical protein